MVRLASLLFLLSAPVIAAPPVSSDVMFDEARPGTAPEAASLSEALAPEDGPGIGGSGIEELALPPPDADELLPGNLPNPAAAAARPLPSPAPVDPNAEFDARIPLDFAYGVTRNPPGAGEEVPVRRNFLPELNDTAGAQ